VYLLDTDIISGLFRGDTDIQNAYKKYDPDDVFIASICVYEILNGHIQQIHDELPKFSRGKPNTLLLSYRSLTDAAYTLARFPVLHFDENALKVYGSLSRKLQESAKANDSKIASIALLNGLTVVTRNVRHFKEIQAEQSDLEIVTW
jgi:predicted nucleic acid-binding protein